MLELLFCTEMVVVFTGYSKSSLSYTVAQEVTWRSVVGAQAPVVGAQVPVVCLHVFSDI